MIYEIYRKIKNALRDMEGAPVKYIGLWNRNIEFLEEEPAWERPAVFVEFAPVKWYCVEPGLEYRATPRIMLHIVTDWVDSCCASLTEPDSDGERPETNEGDGDQDEELGGSHPETNTGERDFDALAPAGLMEFDLPVRIHGALCGLSGDSFCGLDIEESHTNHDHGELLESIEIYSCDASRVLG